MPLFDVAKYPKASFHLSKVVAKVGPEGATHEVSGEFELRGVTKSIAFPAKVAFSDAGVDASASFKINRKDFGVNWSKTLDTGGLVVGETVTIILEIEAAKA